MRSALVFSPDGRVHGLYTEAIDLNQIGRLHIRRATSIEYCNQKHLWQVRNLYGSILFSNPSRQLCLEWENEHLGDADIPDFPPNGDAATGKTTKENICQPR